MENLAEQDRLGPPYVVNYGTGPAGQAMPDYNRAVEIARSAHPSRMLANTNVYRYGLFEEQYDGSVTVTMMDSHIATFRPEGVQIWSCGWATRTTIEALSNLVPGGWFHTRDGVVYFRRYAAGRTPDEPLEEGRVFPYVTGG